MYQLQGELGNTFMWERENVLSYAARIKEIADRIEDAHRLNNNGQVLMVKDVMIIIILQETITIIIIIIIVKNPVI